MHTLSENADGISYEVLQQKKTTRAVVGTDKEWNNGVAERG
jgi:hypothetical protein